MYELPELLRQNACQIDRTECRADDMAMRAEGDTVTPFCC